jgi:hypothetical protein
LAASSSLVPFLEHDPPTHKCFFHNLILGHAREYFKTIHALAPFSPSPTSSNTTLTFIALYPDSDGYFSFFLKNYKPNQNLELFFIPSN